MLDGLIYHPLIQSYVIKNSKFVEYKWKPVDKNSIDFYIEFEKDPDTGKSGRERVVEKMQEADVLILLHGNDEWCAEYIPSKFYEYLWTGRPIWAITHRNPQLDQMLQDRGAYLSLEGDKAGISVALERIWLDWQQKQLRKPGGEPLGVKQAVYKILSEVQKNKESI